MADPTDLGGTFTLLRNATSIKRVGYGAMQLAGKGVRGPPKDPDAAVAVLREAFALGVNHIDTGDFYGPHTTNQIIRQALHPYPAGLVIVTKGGYVRPPDKSWQPARSPADLVAAVHDNLRNLGLDALDVVNLRVGGEHGPVEESIAEPLGVSLLVSGIRIDLLAPSPSLVGCGDATEAKGRILRSVLSRHYTRKSAPESISR